MANEFTQFQIWLSTAEEEAYKRSYRLDHKITFHDALCAAVMLRLGIYKIFTFDRDFQILGFETLP